MLCVLMMCLISMTAMAQETHPILPLGAAAPAFALPGVDGKIHRLSDYAASPVLVIVFTCNHCPIAQAALSGARPKNATQELWSAS